ncbi:MAG: ABC transporter permease [Acidobacteria bacterium]|nr:ABC transporter permease [Acidobacteriota bacterium]
MIIQDLRFGARMLLKKPGFTLIIVLTLALGIGANTAIFSIVRGVLLRPLPYPAPDQLVRVFGNNPGRGFANSNISLHDFIDWQKQNRSFSYLAAYNPGSINLSSAGHLPQRIDYTRVTADFFSVLGVDPIIGRAFQAEDDQPGRGDVVVLSHGFWLNYSGGSSDVLGKKILLDGVPHTIIGVMPRHAGFPSRQIGIWKPIAMTAESSGDRGGRWLNAIGRIKAGMTIEAAQTDLRRIAANLTRQYPATNKDWTIDLVNLQVDQTEEFRPALLMLWGAVGLVLLIACANVANLMLARGFTREREIAVRAALGAGRWRIIRQLMTESLLLSLTGGLAGIILGWWGMELLISLTPDQFQNHVNIDRQVLFYSAGLAILTGIVFGLAPALKASEVNLNDALKDGRQGGQGGLRSKTRRLLVITEVAVTLVMLVTAALLIRSFAEVMKVDAGFDPDQMLTLRIAPPQGQMEPGETEEAFFRRLSNERLQMVDFYRELASRVRAIPTVEAAGVINRPPLAGNWWGLDLTKVGGDRSGRSGPMMTLARVVDPGFFRALGLQLIQGRLLSELDSDRTPRVAVISRTMADRYWPNENPVGRQVSFRDGFDPVTIVGVVGDVRYSGIEVEPDPVFYVPFAQAVFGHFGDWGMSLVIKSKGDPLSLVASVREIVTGLDHDLPLFDIATMQQVIDDATGQRRSNMSMLGILAGLALVLALGGIYSVMSYSVSRRRHEFGIRLALGASPGNLSRMVIKEGVKTTLIGIIIGVGAAFGLTRLVSNQLYGVTENDPRSFLFAALIMLCVSLVACSASQSYESNDCPAIRIAGDGPQISATSQNTLMAPFGLFSLANSSA